MIDIKKFAKIEAAVFCLITVASTIYAARIDNGSWTNPNPLTESGHYMTMGESLVYNIPLGIADGIVAVGLLALAVGIAEVVMEIRQDMERNE